jgi:hypothetical protein
MKIVGTILGGVLLATALTVAAQNRAAVQVSDTGSPRAGGPISFVVKLNEPLPLGAHFDFRISPVATDQEISLGAGEPIDAKRQEFRVTGTLPEGALPGDWHISVIWLFLPGSGWTHNQIAANDLRFQVQGKPYPIPSKADVTLVPAEKGTSK